MDTPTHALLVALARVETALVDIEGRLAAAPQRKQRILERRAALEAELSRVEGDLDDTRTQRRALEQEIDAAGAKISGFETQLGVIKSNDEYQAMVKQIADARGRQTALENQVIELMESEETLAATHASETRRIREAIADNEADEAAVDASLAELGGARTARREERDRIHEQLDVGTRRLLEKLARGKGGRAIVPVVKDACGGCFSALPPQRINETHQADRIVLCEACGRILVWDEEAS